MKCLVDSYLDGRIKSDGNDFEIGFVTGHLERFIIAETANRTKGVGSSGHP